MEVDGFPPIDPNIDYEKILPIHQKRIIAFINHFITNTVSFLNTFVQSCESRLMDFEYKMQKVEASLLILESQLSSISGLDEGPSSKVSFGTGSADGQKASGDALDLPEVVDKETNATEITVVNLESPPTGPRANEDPRFVRFFKMLQFGVPSAAVKHKMTGEGLDPSILDKPGEVVPGHFIDTHHESSSSSSSYT